MIHGHPCSCPALLCKGKVLKGEALDDEELLTIILVSKVDQGKRSEGNVPLCLDTSVSKAAPEGFLKHCIHFKHS